MTTPNIASAAADQVKSEILSAKRTTRGSSSGQFYSLQDSKPVIVGATDKVNLPVIIDKTQNIVEQESDSSCESDDEIFLNATVQIDNLPIIQPPIKMADGVGVKLFSGSPGEDPNIWLSGLMDFIEFKSIPADKRLALLKLRLTGAALAWLMSLPGETTSSFVNLRAAFLERFRPKELEKFRFAKDLFDEKQIAGQSVDDYITQLRSKTASVGLDP